MRSVVKMPQYITFTHVTAAYFTAANAAIELIATIFNFFDEGPIFLPFMIELSFVSSCALRFPSLFRRWPVVTSMSTGTFVIVIRLGATSTSATVSVLHNPTFTLKVKSNFTCARGPRLNGLVDTYGNCLQKNLMVTVVGIEFT